MKKSFDVVGIGSGCIDILHTEEGKIVCPGGAVANTLYSLQKLGLRTGYIGRVGGDQNGRIFAESMKNNGTDLSRLRVNGKTAICSIRVTPKRREMFLRRYFSSITKLTKNDIDYLKNTKAVFMRVSSTVFKQVAEFCEAHDKMLFVTLHEFDKKTDLSVLINGCGIRAIFSGKQRLPMLEPYMDYILNQGTVLVLTKGKEGCEVVTKDRHLSLKGHNTKTLDPTGAGDAFAAGFIYGNMKNRTHEESAKLANYTGAMAVTRYGARTAMKSLNETSLNSIVAK